MFMRAVVLSSVLIANSGCALVAEYPVTAASVGVWGTTGKGPTDHALSYVTDQDCETLRWTKGQSACEPKSNGSRDRDGVASTSRTGTKRSHVYERYQ